MLSQDAFERSYADYSDESELREIFDSAGIPQASRADATTLGVRRRLGRRFHASIDWDNPNSADKGRLAWATYLSRLATKRRWRHSAFGSSASS